MSMKLKVLLLLGGTWLLFITVGCSLAYLPNPPHLIVVLANEGSLALMFWSLFFTASIYGLLYFLILKRFEKLSHYLVRELEKGEYTHPIEVSGSDELAELMDNINKLTDQILSSEEKVELRIKARTKKLMERVEEIESRLDNREKEKKELIIHNQTLMQKAHYDTLTGLPNRILFNEQLNTLIAKAKDEKKLLGILVVGVDNFKLINDTLGRKFGDLVLTEMAGHLKEMVRTGDIIGRSGGAEFSILLQDIVHNELPNLVAEKIISFCASPLKIEHRQVRLVVNIGIAVFPEDGTTLEELSKNADLALFKAKEEGDSHYYRFHKEMTEVSDVKKLSQVLDTAIANKEFTLYYQPKLNLKDGNVIGIEALMRWESAMGIISPARFIPMAEQTGAMLQLGEWAIYEACLNNKSWQDSGLPEVPIAVNLSSYQLLYQDIPAVVDKVLKQTKLDPKYLDLEISAETVAQHYKAIARVLHKLQKLGVNIIIDDFGYPPLSLTILKELPITRLQIAQRFIKNLPGNKEDVVVVKAIIDTARDLGLKVAANGIETLEQLQYLVDHQCEVGQGYFFSKPLSKSNFISNSFYMNGLSAQTQP